VSSRIVFDVDVVMGATIVIVVSTFHRLASRDPRREINHDALEMSTSITSLQTKNSRMLPIPTKKIAKSTTTTKHELPQRMDSVVDISHCTLQHSFENSHNFLPRKVLSNEDGSEVQAYHRIAKCGCPPTRCRSSSVSNQQKTQEYDFSGARSCE
jgi:hypothetical protein